MLELINLTKYYGDTLAVKELNLRVEPGQIFGFLGPNGAGKTTTFKMIAGLEKPSVGTVIFNGYDIRKEPTEVKKMLGYVADIPYLYDFLTGREFLEFLADMRRLGQAKKEANIEHYLSVFEMNSQADNLISTYSQGMRQKIALCGALIHEPKILVLDEPLAAVDVIIAKQIKDLLIDFADKGNTVFFSTHIMEVAEYLCTKIGIIAHGELVAVGTLNELKRRAYSESGTLESIFMQLVKGNGQSMASENHVPM